MSKPERLAYWYFRLNGFMTIEDFVVHPDRGAQQRTDADMIAVRFQHRSENKEVPMEDDPKVSRCDTFANVIIAEIKTGSCHLNGPWTDRDKANMQRVLRAVGCVPPERIDEVAKQLYDNAIWSDENATIRLFAIGETPTPELTLPDGQQLTWREIIGFCHQRFRAYRNQKSSVGIWPTDGRRLKQLSQGREPDVDEIRKLFRLQPFQNDDFHTGGN